MLRTVRSTILALCLFVLSFDRLVDFLSMNGNVFRGIEAKTYLVATDVNNRDDDVVSDYEGFVLFAS